MKIIIELSYDKIAKLKSLFEEIRNELSDSSYFSEKQLNAMEELYRQLD